MVSIEGCVKGLRRDPAGLPDLDDRESLTVDEGIGGVGADFQNPLHLLDGQSFLRRFTHGNILLRLLRARAYFVFKVHPLTRKAIFQ